MSLSYCCNKFDCRNFIRKTLMICLCATIVISIPINLNSQISKDDFVNSEISQDGLADKITPDGTVTEKEYKSLSKYNAEEILTAYKVDIISHTEIDSNLKTLEGNYKGAMMINFAYGGGNDTPSKNLSMVIGELQSQYKDVKFFACEGHNDLLNKYGIKHAPSSTLFAPFDVVKGEKPTKEGEFKVIDIASNGPNNYEGINKNLKFFNNFYLSQNITNPKGSVLPRFEGGNTPRKVTY
jgi:hypothetical protein